ncbi:uncharacterized protein DEA37_0014376 [Paragonimus westermani]|uniref:Uncharacterized protein n=1 Tax=Paragonimus westermani TaxID=34504 RepID=A0A5J4NGT0_9TREM|nr:uncharacterized protein DEA37_0014376 [Paragonimus westermani]
MSNAKVRQCVRMLQFCDSQPNEQSNCLDQIPRTAFLPLFFLLLLLFLSPLLLPFYELYSSGSFSIFYVTVERSGRGLILDVASDMLCLGTRSQVYAMEILLDPQVDEDRTAAEFNRSTQSPARCDAFLLVATETIDNSSHSSNSTYCESELHLPRPSCDRLYERLLTMSMPTNQ